MRGSPLLPALTLSLATSLGAQLPPVRQIGPIVASANDLLGTMPSVRVLSGGRVLVSDGIKRRLLLFDSTLRSPTVILDALGAAGSGFPTAANPAQRSGTLIAARGDTTLFLDLPASSLLSIDGDGKLGRVIAVPRTSDIQALAAPARYGQPVMDAAGRLIYRRDLPPVRTPTGFTFSDSVQIVRANFDTRTVDTLAYIFAPSNGLRMNQSVLPDGTQQLSVSPPAFDAADDWVALPDGSVALLRWRDYHVDWVNPDRTTHSSPKTQWDWHRLTDDDKARLADSLKVVYAKADTELTAQIMAQMAGRGFGGPGSPKMVVVVTPVAVVDLPDYPPPFMPRMAQVDPDGRIWVPERGSAGLRPSSLVYDIIDRQGQIVDRVQVPAPYVVVAIGRGGSVYLAAPTQASVLPGVLGSTFMMNMPIQPTMKFVRAVLPNKP